MGTTSLLMRGLYALAQPRCRCVYIPYRGVCMPPGGPLYLIGELPYKIQKAIPIRCQQPVGIAFSYNVTIL